MAPYAYPQTNSELVTALKLEPHPEGGFFAETYRSPRTVNSPFVSKQRALHTEIYYLLTADAGHGKLHQHQSDAIHLHHAGRARFVLVPGDGSGIDEVVLGENATAGERRQLFVPAGTYKAIFLPEEDIKGDIDRERVGCLMSEVVVPFDDHTFPTVEDVKKRLAKHPDADALVAKLKPMCSDP